MKNFYALLFALSLATVSAKASAQIAKHTINHTVKKGETLSSIARKHHTTITKIRHANGLKKGAVIKFGKVLKVPTLSYAAKVKTPTASTKYVIKRGDTLSAIARKHHTTIKKLREANGLKKSDVIKIGKVLKVPQAKKQITFVKRDKKTSTKKLTRTLASLDTISLENTKEEKRSTFSNIFGNSNKKVEEDKCQKITSLAKTKLGKKYVWGASGNKNTYDCSSFVKYVYKKQGIELPRTSIMQSKVGKYIKRDELQKGDLIFFDTSKKRKGYVNHVGIYLGDNKFIHASSAKKKVVVSNLSKFYGQRYKGARRPS